MAFGRNKEEGNHAAHADDVEASASDRTRGGLSHDIDESELPEYEALDRFITRYDASGEQKGLEEEEDRKNKKPPSLLKLIFSGDLEVEQDQNLVPPDAWLETDMRQGISDHDVEERRKRFGWNELTAEKENQLRKFMGFFQGPILYGKWASDRFCHEGAQEWYLTCASQ